MQDYRVPVIPEDRVKAGLAAHLVAAKTGAAPDRIATGGRVDSRTSRSRWITLYLTHISYGWTLERVAHVFGLNRATVSIACRWVEDARDRAAIDELLNQLEAFLADLYRTPPCEVAQ